MADEIMTDSTAMKIRQWMTDLLGSRVAACREEELLRCRNDYETRLHERDVLLAEYRERIARMEAKLDQWEMVIIPLTSPAARLLNPRPPTETLIEPDPNSWASIKRKHYEDLTKEPDGEQIPAEQEG